VHRYINPFSDDSSFSRVILGNDFEKFPFLFNFSLSSSRIIEPVAATRSRRTFEARETPKRDLRSAKVYLLLSATRASRCHDSPFVNGDTSATSMDAVSRWAIAPHTNWISRGTRRMIDRAICPRARNVARRIDAEKFRKVVVRAVGPSRP